MSIEKTRKLLAAKGAAPVLGAALLFGTAACSEDSEGTDQGTSLEDIQNNEEEEEEEEENSDGASEEDIAEAPNEEEEEDFFQEGDTEGFFEDQESFIDEQVTVSGKIVEVFNANAFVIGEGELATLVTRATTANMVTLQPGEIAQVTGQVGSFVLVDVEEDLGVDFQDEEFSPFENGPFINATDVNLLDDEDGGNS